MRVMMNIKEYAQRSASDRSIKIACRLKYRIDSSYNSRYRRYDREKVRQIILMCKNIVKELFHP